MSYIAGIDVGGTFTDVTLLDTESGHCWIAKTPSTPQDQSLGFLAGLRRAAALAGIPLATIDRCFHGTTVATNTILQRSETRLGLLTTEGFKDVLEIGRHDIPREGNYYGWVKPARPVSPALIREIPERIDRHGQVLRPLDEEAARQAVRSLHDFGVESIAISLLYSFLNPAHEQRLRAIIAEEHPQALISLSSEVLPRLREFERTMTTVLNAYVAPHVSRYLTALERRLRDHGCAASLLIMKSNGGVVGAETAARQAINTAVSGPAAGVVGAVAAAAQAGRREIISIDVGGTSADVCLTRDGRPEVTTEGNIGGFPMELPMLDVRTIGAGGGSIAWITPSGALAVGPRSAGAEPGPACYGHGGHEPTATDAQLVLGRLPRHLLGGEIALDVNAAERAIAECVAAPLGLSVVEAAAGIIAVLDGSMIGAIRAVSIARGLDPRDYTLVPFGGAGPLHAVSLAAALGITTVLVPRWPGVLSTEGLLRTDLRNDYVQTCAQTGILQVEDLNAILARLEALAHADLERERIPSERRSLRRSADLRYRHQGYEIAVPLAAGPLTPTSLRELEAAFHAEHRRLYTYDLPKQQTELVNLRVSATGQLPHRTNMASRDTNGAAGSPSAPEPTERRRIYFNETGWSDTPCYARGSLLAGARLHGPLAVDQDDSTTVVAAGQHLVVDEHTNLIITLV